MGFKKIFLALEYLFRNDLPKNQTTTEQQKSEPIKD